MDYIFINQPGMYNDSSNLYEEVTSTSEYKTIFKSGNFPVNADLKKGRLGYTRWSSLGIVVNNISYSVWSDKINSSLRQIVGSTEEFKIRDRDISIIDGGPSKETVAGISGGIPDVTALGRPDVTGPVNISLKTKYINILKNENPSTSSQPTEIPTLLTDSELYKNSHPGGINSQVLLLLNTLPFKPFNDTVVKNLFQVPWSQVILLPTHYLLWICGTLWRASYSGGDPIDWTNSEIPTAGIKEYIHGIGDADNKTYNAGTQIDDGLLNLPTKTKETLINYFTTWVSENSTDFITPIIAYSAPEVPLREKSEKYGTQLCDMLGVTSSLILPAPTILNSGGMTGGLALDGFDSYFSSFKIKFESSEIETEESDKEESENIQKQLDPLKLEIYNYFKNIYDKWIAGSTSKTLSYNACGNKTNLFDYFRFVDRAI